MVSGVGRGMGVLDGGGNRRRGRSSFGVNLGRPVITNGDSVAQLRESDALFPSYFGRTRLRCERGINGVLPGADEVGPTCNDVDGQLTVSVRVTSGVERVDTRRERCAEQVRQQVVRHAAAGVVEVIQVSRLTCKQ